MEHYGKARREGLKVYSAALQAHQDPYLPVLEDREPNLSVLNRRSLGVISIPLERVIGSVSQGRSFAFTQHFLPILESGSEFAAKWETLYTSVEEEGLSQPVTALEYMGDYYITEGNKRVSVMKSMNAVDIEADVTRVVPPRTDDPKNIAWFEYCDFTKDTGLYGILFTQPGSYTKLLAMPGVRSGDTFTEDEILSLRKVFNAFRIAYLSLYEREQPMPTGDAFLQYLVAFGYLGVLHDDQKKTTERVRLMSQELKLDKTVRLVMEPEAQTKPGPTVPLISSLLRPSRIKAAFLYTRAPEDSAWEYWHEMGRIALETTMKDRVITTARVIASRNEYTDIVEPLIREGYTAFFATSPVMLNSCIKPALEHPEVSFFCCAPLDEHLNIRTYYIRFYEAKFLMGLAAGILADNGKIGYIADYPIFGIPAAVNAFALGARMVNPEARIYLNWTSAGYFDPQNPFLDPEIRVICNRDITAPSQGSREVGLHLRSENGISNIATLIPQWEPFYRAMIERQLSGISPASENKKASTNYWWGMRSNVVDVAFSKRFSPYSTRLIGTFRDALQTGEFTPFEGRLVDQTGQVRCRADQRLMPSEILCMDYLLDNVTGDLPGMDTLVESARTLVRLQGVHEDFKSLLSSFSWE